MKFEVASGGRRRTIEVQRSGNGWIVAIEGRAVSASLAQAGSRWSLLVGRLGSGASEPAVGTPARSFEIAVAPRGRGEQSVWVDGREVSVSILDPRARAARGRVGPSEETGPSLVVSPMPGRVVKVLAAPGDVVSPGQGLVVIEAMKMENELRARRGGTVAEVRVREGDAVDANTVLVVIDL